MLRLRETRRQAGNHPIPLPAPPGGWGLVSSPLPLFDPASHGQVLSLPSSLLLLVSNSRRDSKHRTPPPLLNSPLRPRLFSFVLPAAECGPRLWIFERLLKKTHTHKSCSSLHTWDSPPKRVPSAVYYWPPRLHPPLVGFLLPLRPPVIGRIALRDSRSLFSRRRLRQRYYLLLRSFGGFFVCCLPSLLALIRNGCRSGGSYMSDSFSFPFLGLPPFRFFGGWPW